MSSLSFGLLCLSLLNQDDGNKSNLPGMYPKQQIANGCAIYSKDAVAGVMLLQNAEQQLL